MERRYAVFIALSLAAVLGSQVMRSILFPRVEEKPPVVGLNAEDAAEVQQERVTPKDERDSTTGEPDRLVGD